MKALRQNLPVLIIFIFELLVGIFLLIEPEKFTRFVIILFGAVMLLVGVINLVRFIRYSKADQSEPIILVSAVISLIIGAICVFATDFIIGLFSVLTLIYGIIIIVAGVFKIEIFIQAKKTGEARSLISLFSGIIAVILGIIITVYSLAVTKIMWQFIGISLIIEAGIDIIAFMHALGKKQGMKKMLEESTDTTKE